MAISVAVSPNLVNLTGTYVGLKQYAKFTFDFIDTAAAIPGGTYQISVAVADAQFSLHGGVGESWSAAGATISANVPATPANTHVLLHAILSFAPASPVSVVTGLNLDVTLKQGAATLSTESETVNASGAADLHTALVMVLDRSGSMTIDEGGMPRVQRLRDATLRCLALMADTDYLGVVAFNGGVNSPDPLALGQLATTRSAATTLFTSGADLNPAGTTSIGAGVIQGYSMLTGAATLTNTQTALLVVTDGQENTAPLLSTVAIDTDTYAVGIGTPDTIAVNALTHLTGGNYTVLTGALTGDNQFALDKYLIQIQGDIKNNVIVVDPEAHIAYGQEQKWPFFIADTEPGFEAILVSPRADLLTFELESPHGKRYRAADASPHAGFEFHSASGIQFFRFLQTAEQGRWIAHVSLGRRSDNKYELAARVALPATDYAFIGRAPSTLLFDAGFTTSGLNVGADLLLGAVLTEGGLSLAGPAQVKAQLTYPDGSVAELPLTATTGGRYQASERTFSAGLYAAHFFAQGQTLSGTTFTREARRTVAVLAPGQQPPTGLSPIPPSEGGPGAPGGGTGSGGGSGGGTGSGGGIGVGPGNTGYPPGSLGDLFARFPELERLLERCCRHCGAHAGHHCGCRHG